MKKTAILFLVLGLETMTSTFARADSMGVFGVGSRAIGLASAYTAVSDDFSAVYYNPGAIVQPGKAHVGLAFYSAKPDLKFDSANTNFESGEVQVKRPEGFMIGGTNSLFRRDPFEMSFGFTVNLPSSGIILVEMPERTSAHFPRYLNHNRIFAGLGVAGKFGRWFSLGLAIHQFAEFAGPIQATIPTTSGVKDQRGDHFNRVADDNFKIDLNYAIAPAFGVMLFPTDDLRLGVAYREDISLGIDSPVRTDIGLPLPLPGAGASLAVDLPVQGRTFYEPKQLALGAAYGFGRFLLAADLTWYQYSEYPPTVLPLDDFQLPIEVEKVLEDLNANFVVGGPIDYDFKDTYVPRVGIEYQPLPAWSLRAGYSFEPSPAPEQVGEVNVLWPDEQIISTGLGVEAEDVFGQGQRFRLDLHGQLRLLAKTTHSKSSESLIATSSALRDNESPSESLVDAVLNTNPGYPSASAEGSIIAGGITLSFFY